jgi:hypothetical protein
MPTAHDALELITDRRYLTTSRPGGDLIEMQSSAILNELRRRGAGELDARTVMAEAVAWIGGYTAITPGDYRIWVPAAAFRDEVLRPAA